MQVQELVGIVPWTFIAQICNLFIQMYLIKRFLFKPINEMLEKRRAAADAEITDAEAAKKEANSHFPKFCSVSRGSGRAGMPVISEICFAWVLSEKKSEKELRQELPQKEACRSSFCMKIPSGGQRFY